MDQGTCFFSIFLLFSGVASYPKYETSRLDNSVTDFSDEVVSLRKILFFMKLSFFSNWQFLIFEYNAYFKSWEIFRNVENLGGTHCENCEGDL